MQDQPDFIPPAVRFQSARKKTNFLGISLALALAVGAFFSGFQASALVKSEGQSASILSAFSFFSTEKTSAVTPDTGTRPDLAEFWRVWDTLDKKFSAASSSQEISDQDLINGAITGMVRAYGDPYTVYMPPSESEKFNEDISGNFGGVGMEVGMRKEVLTVIAPLPNTPAAKAGILTGDLIVKINGKTTDGISVDEAVNLIRGKQGTSVDLSIYREGEMEFREFSIVRDTINIPTIAIAEQDDTTIIRLYSFNAISARETRDALRTFAASKNKSLILDLRGNPGGYLQEAVAIASYFLPTGKVVVKEFFKEGREEIFRSTGNTLNYDFNPKNLVVLVDNGSASASEILAGALKEHGIATIIGSDTYGKGSVQELINLPSQASLKVTVARWLTPNGNSISETGIKPDITIKRTPEQRLNNEDPQEKAALDFLQGKVVKSEEEKS